MPAKFIIIMVTAPSKKEADKIVAELIKNKLIACGNILGNIDSVFLWKSKIEKAKEVLLILKTRADLFDEVAALVAKAHSYEVPEIIALPIVRGAKKYMKWLDTSVKKQ